MNVKIKEKVYRTYLVRSALLHWEYTLTLKKAQEKKLEIAEMRMLRWMCGVTMLARIRYEKKPKLEEISTKVQKGRFKWYGHTTSTSLPWAYDANRGALRIRMNEGDGNGSTRQEGEGEGLRGGDDWIALHNSARS